LAAEQSLKKVYKKSLPEIFSWNSFLNFLSDSDDQNRFLTLLRLTIEILLYDYFPLLNFARYLYTMAASFEKLLLSRHHLHLPCCGLWQLSFAALANPQLLSLLAPSRQPKCV
jgi:hypothetical protein